MSFPTLNLSTTTRLVSSVCRTVSFGRKREVGGKCRVWRVYYGRCGQMVPFCFQSLTLCPVSLTHRHGAVERGGYWYLVFLSYSETSNHNAWSDRRKCEYLHVYNTYSNNRYMFQCIRVLEV
jgi:hypothetical protein